ncbi:MAG: hypothetical protein EBX39_01405 [Actinobacteria bacterium]|nr:hypothetical protein [Actinomycetota bacterium]
MRATISTTKVFKRRQKVVAAVDLPGVPAGTFGKIWLVTGVTWIRYHVAFDNGGELANLDASQLRDRRSWLAEQKAAEHAELEAARALERDAMRAEALANLADGPVGH